MKKNRINEKVIIVIAFVCYIAFNLLCVKVHEHWRDEGQAWMIAKSLSVGELIKILPGEGHPILWYLVIMPFAKLGFPYRWFSLISCAIMALAAWILLKSRLPLWTRVVLLFTPIFSYYNTAMARSYALIVLELVLVGAFYLKRKEKPVLWAGLIILLFQTHMYVAGLAVMLTLQMVYECVAIADKRKQKTVGIGLIGLNLLFLFKELSGGASEGVGSVAGDILSDPLDFFGQALFSIQRTLNAGFDFVSNIYREIMVNGIIIILIFLIVMSIWKWKENWQELLIFLGGIGAICVIIALIYNGTHIQHALVLIGEILLWLWIFYQKTGFLFGDFKPLPTVLKTVITVFFMGMILQVGYCSYRDWKLDYSTAKRMAQYLAGSYGENDVFAISDVADSFPNMIAYTDGKLNFVYPDSEEEYTYYKRLGDTDAGRGRSLDLKGKNVYYLYSQKQENDALELVYEQSNFNLMVENFYLYQKK